MNRKCVRREIGKQNHFLREKYFCVRVLSFLATLEWGTQFVE